MIFLFIIFGFKIKNHLTKVEKRLKENADKWESQAADIAERTIQKIGEKAREEGKRVWRRLGPQVETFVEQIYFVLRHSIDSIYQNPVVISGDVTSQSEVEKFMQSLKESGEYDFSQYPDEFKVPDDFKQEALIDGEAYLIYSKYEITRSDESTYQLHAHTMYNNTEITEEGRIAQLTKYDATATVHTDPKRKDGTVDEYRKLTQEEIDEIISIMRDHVKKAMNRLLKKFF